MSGGRTNDTARLILYGKPQRHRRRMAAAAAAAETSGERKVSEDGALTRFLKPINVNKKKFHIALLGLGNFSLALIVLLLSYFGPRLMAIAFMIIWFIESMNWQCCSCTSSGSCQPICADW